LSFPWSTVLEPGETPRARHSTGSDLCYFHVEVRGRIYTGVDLLAAEVKAWSDLHDARRVAPPSLTGTTITSCPSCLSPMVNLSESGPATGYNTCLEVGCCWSEVGYLTKYGQNVLGQSWPDGTVVTSASDGAKTITVTATTHLDVFVGVGDSFDLAEHHAFCDYLEAFEVANLNAQIGETDRTALLTAC